MLKSFLLTVSVSVLVLYWFGAIAALVALIVLGVVVYRGI